MSYIKRDNWTNNEVLRLVDGCSLALDLRDPATLTAEDKAFDEGYAAAIQSVMITFGDMKMSPEYAGATALDTDTNMIVGVGPALPR